MMEIGSSSTADVEPRRRFEYWNDLVAKAVFGVNAAQTSRHDFDATISTRRLHDAAFTSFHSPAHEIDRTHWVLAASLAALGRIPEAKLATAQVLALEPNFTTAGICSGAGIPAALAAPFTKACRAAGLP
jgi:hypothetical protein